MKTDFGTVTATDPTTHLSRAFGETYLSGVIRSEPGDFRVDEVSAVQADGSGEHLLMRIEKTSANTEWAAAEIARALGIRPRDVGFAGRKDRHAITRQWLSAWLPGRDPGDWEKNLPPSVRVLEKKRHSRKLRVGALQSNRFEIVVRELDGDISLLEQRVAHVAAEGVPNYFGPQRFGRDGGNLVAAARMFRNRRLRCTAKKRGLYLSAARSFLFNAVLERRVVAHTWSSMLNGDVANLDGSRSVFPVSEVDEALRERAVRMDIHPTGPLWGRGDLMSTGDVAALESDIAASLGELSDGLEQAKLEQARRALRLKVTDLSCERDENNIVIRFELPAGGFATSVLRELLDWRDASQLGRT